MRDFSHDNDLPALELAVTDACNNRCLFCTTGWVNAESKEPIDHVSPKILGDRMREAYDGGARRVTFHGGEPTLRRDLGELVAFARELGYERVSIFTHARAAASRSGADWLVGLEFDWFHVSIQAGTAEAHDSAVGAAAFAQTVAGVRNLIERRQRVKVNGVLTRQMLDTLPAFARLVCDLGPEEVGLDTIKPTGAFRAGRALYTDLGPRLGPYAGSLRDAILAMNAAGINAYLTSFPPCLVPGIEHFVSEEPAATRTMNYVGQGTHKLTWRQSLMVKREECRGCAYDETCCGVYRPYAEAYGLDELAPIAARREIPKVVLLAREQEGPLTRALRALFVTAGSPETGVVRGVRLLEDGRHELRCSTREGDFAVMIGPNDASRAYATTKRFAVTYRADGGATPDVRFLDGIVRKLRLAESYLEKR